MTNPNTKLVKYREGTVAATPATEAAGPQMLCPITGTPLRAARAKGGSLWYSPYSRGRLVTLVMAKHFLGADGAREIWVRAGLTADFSEKCCPACNKPMRPITEPQWLGGFEIEVCTTCQLIWFDPDENVDVPHPEDLLTPQGDSTRHSDVGKALVDISQRKADREDRRDAIVYDGPRDLHKRLLGFLMLPVKDDDEATPEKWWVTGGLVVLMMLLQWLVTSSEVISEFGFYPGDPLKNYGLNVLSSVVLHGGWVHLLGNLYFFLLFSADVEGFMGSLKYAGLLILLAVGGDVVLCALSGAPQLPHVGLSGVIMGLMVVYAFIHPHHRFAYLVPSVHTLTFSGGHARIWGKSWIRVPFWVVVLFYVAFNLLDYFLYESSGVSAVSYSGHLGGALIGFIYAILFISRSPDAP